MGNIHGERIDDLKKIMKAEDYDIVLVFTADEHGSEYIDPHYGFREYLSGFSGSAGDMLICANEAGLFTDGRYFIQAEKELERSGIVLYRIGEKGVKGIFERVDELAAQRNGEGLSTNIASDLKLINAESYKKLLDLRKKYDVSITDTDLAGRLWKDRPARSASRIYSLSENITGTGTEEKISKMREKIVFLGADSLILTDLSDIMWTFNIRGEDIPYNPVAYAYAYIDADAGYLFVNEDAPDEETVTRLTKAGIKICPITSFDDHIRWLKGRSILYDPLSMNAHVYELLTGNEMTARPSYEYISRHVKNQTEQRLIRDYHIEDGLVLTRFIYKIKKLVREAYEIGTEINEYEAAMMLDDMRKSLKDNRGLSFETISAYGKNGAIIHYSPAPSGSAVLKPEGFLLLDSGGQYTGATTDVTRTIALGELTEEMKLDYTAVLKGMLDLSDAVFLEGVRGENLDILAREPIWERYIDYRHGTGHGVGAMLNVHEGPQAFRYRINDNKPQPRLEPGMLTSDEPGIYHEGRYGIRIENLLMCVEKKCNEWGRFLGFDTMTLVPYEREAIIPEALTERQRKLINEYHSTIYYLYSKRLDEEERKWLLSVTSEI